MSCMPAGTSISAASSPTPSATSGRRAPQSLKNRSISERSLRASVIGAVLAPRSVFVRPQRARGPIEHGIDELVTVGGAEALRETDTFVDHHSIRHFRSRLQLVCPD